MKILILGAGKMGTFLTDVLCTQHEVAIFDTNPKNLRFVFNTYRMTTWRNATKTSMPRDATPSRITHRSTYLVMRCNTPTSRKNGQETPSTV